MCTLDKRGNVFVLTLTGEGEHRISPSLIDSIRSALSQAKSQASEAAAGSYALVTTAQGKFFSNGFDVALPKSDGSDSDAAGSYDRLQYLAEYMKPLFADLFSLPMPTIAAVTGHAVTAGFVLAISHDYVLMRKDRGVIYMSELDIGVTLPEYAMAVLGEKLAWPAAKRDVLLRAKKVRAEEAVEMGLVDSAHGETMEAAMRLAEELVRKKWNGEIYGEIRKSLYPETCKQLGLTTKHVLDSNSRL